MEMKIRASEEQARREEMDRVLAGYSELVVMGGIMRRESDGICEGGARLLRIEEVLRSGLAQ